MSHNLQIALINSAGFKHVKVFGSHNPAALNKVGPRVATARTRPRAEDPSAAGAACTTKGCHSHQLGNKINLRVMVTAGFAITRQD